MKVDSVCERIKIWSGRNMAQQVILNISPEGDVKVERHTHIKSEEDLDKESAELATWHEIA